MKEDFYLPWSGKPHYYKERIGEDVASESRPKFPRRYGADSVMLAFHARRFLFVMWIGFLGLSAGCSPLSEAARDLLGKPVPDGRLMLMSGEDLALRGRNGVNMAILFWATWCPHSQGAIADYEALAQHYGRRRGLEFYAVSLDRNEDFDQLKARIQAQKLGSLIHVFSGNESQDEAFLSLRGKHLPYAVFVDNQGIVRYVGIGLGGLEDFISERYGS